MDSEIISILDRINSGEINIDKALETISQPIVEDNSPEPARKLKIRIVTDEGRQLFLPSIPLGLLSGLGSIGLKFAKLGLSKSDEIDEYARKALENLSSEDVKLIINSLRNFGSFTLVDVVDKNDNTEVKIELI